MTTGPRALHGTPVVPGIGYAPALVVRTEVPETAIASFRSRPPLTEGAALQEFDVAAAAVADRLAERAGAAEGATADVLAATAALARDSGLRAAVRGRLESGGDLLAALASATDEFVARFTEMGGVMAERATDLRDIERRITARLVGEPEPGVPDLTEPAILMADDLAPVDTAGLRPQTAAALVTERGGPTSHTAIIARQLAIPCVVGVAGATSVPTGTPVLVDGTTGTVEISPDEPSARRRTEESGELRRTLAAWTGPGRTADDHPVRLLANVQDGASARTAADGPAEGVGLFRTELCFLDRAEEPTVDEQSRTYAEVLAAFGPQRSVVVRTLDAGSDKPIPFASHSGEENPALGVRGLRLSYENPGLLERQLQAIADAARATGTSPRVMAPMVATVAEARAFAERVRALGLQAGIMVEVPSAALLAPQLAGCVDFLSIGTNDLTQYTMAADRMSSDLAHLTDPWQPAVLALVARTADAGRRVGKPVGVCGEAAADPDLAVALVGMGITSLSMAPAAIGAVGARLAAVAMRTCADSARAALDQNDPEAARRAVRETLSA